MPPRNLKNLESSLVFIPQKSRFTLPSPDEITDSLAIARKDGVLIVPPGAGLCRLFEKELKASFANLDLEQLQTKLPKLLVEDMELAESAEINVKDNVIAVEIRGSVLDEVCSADGESASHSRARRLLVKQRNCLCPGKNCGGTCDNSE